jgi:hypothetical protein
MHDNKEVRNRSKYIYLKAWAYPGQSMLLSGIHSKMANTSPGGKYVVPTAYIELPARHLDRLLVRSITSSRCATPRLWNIVVHWWTHEKEEGL